METPVTESSVESVQQTITAEVNEQGDWEVDLPNPNEAIDESEFSVINLYKNGGNDSEVNVLVRIDDGAFVSYEYLDSGDSVVHVDSVDELVSYLNQIVSSV